jgi:hypothetical protein
MSTSSSDDKPRSNNPYAWIEGATADIWDATKRALEAGEANLISDEALQRMMTAAVRLYYMKADLEERTFNPLLGQDREEITPTEVLAATSELLRAVRLGPMELALWFRRRPDEPPLHEEGAPPNTRRNSEAKGE